VNKAMSIETEKEKVTSADQATLDAREEARRKE
jgi:hypothetical protein